MTDTTVPADVRALAEEARRHVLSPAYVHTGFNDAIRIAAELAILADRKARGVSGAEGMDFGHVASLLRKYANRSEDDLRAVLSNNLNVVLAALDLAAQPITVEGLADEVERLTKNAQTDTWLMQGYHQLCKEHGFAPSSGELIAAAKRAALATQGANPNDQ